MAAMVDGERQPSTDATFDAFYRRVYPQLVGVVLALRGREVVAEEITQEALLRAFARWDQVTQMDRPDLWVQRVALNLATSRLRRVGAEARALSRQVTGRSGEGDIERVDADLRFWAAIRQLPVRQRQVVALYYVLDMPVTDIAVAMGRAQGTVKSHLHAARARLTVLLDDEERS